MTEENALRTIKKIILKFVDPKTHQLFLFGSRANGKARKFSDFDIAVNGKKPLPLKTLALIKETLEDSDLPFEIDVVDLARTNKKFKKLALTKIKKL